MNIGVITDKNTEDAMVPETYEEGKYIIVVDSEKMAVVEMAAKSENAQDIVDMLIKHNCEAIVSGPISDTAAFEAIAGKDITRYRGDGLDIGSAVECAHYNELPLLTDYVGGTGCTEEDEHHECDCGHGEEEEE